LPSTLHLKKLSAISDVIIAEEINFIQLRDTLHEMKSLFNIISEIDTESPAFEKDIHHETGKAIGPKWAELCIDDIMRTKRFSKGAFHAITDVLKNKKEEKPVTLLYVGTGPYATLVMHLVTQFKPEELQFIFVEVNPTSVASLKNCIKNLGVEAYVKSIISTDAVQLQLENAHEIDILLLECLQFALVKEQQVALTYNLISQLKKEVVLLPEEIKLSICLIDSNAKMRNNLNGSDEPFYKNINTIFVLNKEEIHKRSATLNRNELLSFEPLTTVIPSDRENYNRISINTEIAVYGNEKLEIDECSLTMNYKLNDLENIKSCQTVTTQYIVNEAPTFKVDWI
jgi:predicted RNA methylase